MGVLCGKLVSDEKFNDSPRGGECEPDINQKKQTKIKANSSVSLCLSHKIPEENRAQDGRKQTKMREGTTTSIEDIRKFYDFEPKLIGKSKKINSCSSDRILKRKISYLFFSNEWILFGI